MLWGTWRVNGQLAVSRAIGDGEYKPYVTAVPDIREIHLDGGEDFLILACDGLWDFLSEDCAAQEVYYMVAENPDDTDRISQRLAILARQQGSTDNITVIVVFLREPSKIAAEAHRWANRNGSPVAMDTSLDNANNPFVNSNGAGSNDNILSQKAEGLLLNLTDNFRHNDPEIFDKEKTNGKRSAEFDDEDFGPETDVDAVDDAVLSPVQANRSFGEDMPGLNPEGAFNPFIERPERPSVEVKEKASLESDLEKHADGFCRMGSPRNEAPTPPADTVHDVAGLVDNTVESDSEDEWNYFKGNEANKENISQPDKEVADASEEDNMSQLNPNAAEFVPVSPTRSNPSPICRSLINDEVIACSPRRPVAVDITVPNEHEFEKEVKSRPSEVESYSNGHDEDDHNVTPSEDNIEKLLDGKNLDDIPEFHPGSTPNKPLPTDEFHFGPNATPFTPKLLDQSEAGLSTLAVHGDDSVPTLDTSFDVSKASPEPPKESDPMSMSFYANEGEANPFDLNEVQVLPENIEEFLKKEDVMDDTISDLPEHHPLEEVKDNDKDVVPTTDLDKPSYEDEKELESPVQPERDLVSPVEPQKDLESPVEPQKDLESPVEPQKDLESPVEPQKDLESPVEPQKDLESPVQPQKDLESPVEPQKDLESPIELQKDLESTVQPEKDLVFPVEPQKDLESPFHSEKALVSPVELQKDLASPVQPQKDLVSPVEPQKDVDFFTRTPEPAEGDLLGDFSESHSEQKDHHQEHLLDVSSPVNELPESESPVCELKSHHDDLPESESPVCDLPESESPVCEAPESPLVCDLPESEAPVTNLPESEAPVCTLPQAEESLVEDHPTVICANEDSSRQTQVIEDSLVAESPIEEREQSSVILEETQLKEEVPQDTSSPIAQREQPPLETVFTDTESVATTEVNSFLDRSEVPDVTSPLSPNEERRPDILDLDHPLSKCVFPLPTQGEQIDVKTDNIAPQFAEEAIVTPSENSEKEIIPEKAVEEVKQPELVEEVKETVQKVEQVKPVEEVKEKEAKKTTAAPGKKPTASKASPKVAARTSSSAKPQAKPPTASKVGSPLKPATAKLGAASPAAKPPAKPKTLASSAPSRSLDRKPLTNGDVKPPTRTAPARKIDTAPVKPPSARPTAPRTTSATGPTKTAASRPGTAPKTTAPTRSLTSGPSVTASKSATAPRTTTTSRPATATKTVAAQSAAALPKRPAVSAPAKPRVPPTRTATKAAPQADAAKQTKDTVNKLTASRTGKTSSTRSPVASHRADAKPATLTRTTVSKTTTTTTIKSTTARKPAEISRNVSKSKPTKIEKPKENGVASVVVEEITVVKVVKEGEELLKDNSPVDNKLIVESGLIDVKTTD